MVELLVALIVGAVMIHALLAAQKYSLYLATERDNTWKCLNVSQELFARLGLPDLTRRPTGTWIAIQGADQGRWKSAYLARDQRSDIRSQQKQTDITSNFIANNPKVNFDSDVSIQNVQSENPSLSTQISIRGDIASITTGVDRSSHWMIVYTGLADTILQWRIMTTY